MKFCEECSKKLGFFEGYHHPAMGKKKLLFSNCFDVIYKSVEEWRKFVTANSFNNYELWISMSTHFVFL